MTAHEHRDDAPAEIRQSEWDEHRGRLLRAEGLIGSLTLNLKRAAAGADLVRVEMRALRTSMAEFKTNVVERLDKHSDWRETTGRHDMAKLEKELDRFRQKEDRRIAGWVKIALGIVAAIVEAGILHWLKW